jgi:hypothetical protein
MMILDNVLVNRTVSDEKVVVGEPIENYIRAFVGNQLIIISE